MPMVKRQFKSWRRSDRPRRRRGRGFVLHVEVRRTPANSPTCGGIVLRRDACGIVRCGGIVLRRRVRNWPLRWHCFAPPRAELAAAVALFCAAEANAGGAPASIPLSLWERRGEGMPEARRQTRV